jgi:glutathione S-transferase
MADLILTTFDWVRELPRGFVRDLRVRWALEEAGLPYRVARHGPPVLRQSHADQMAHFAAADRRAG